MSDFKCGDLVWFIHTTYTATSHHCHACKALVTKHSAHSHVTQAQIDTITRQECRGSQPRTSYTLVNSAEKIYGVVVWDVLYRTEIEALQAWMIAPPHEETIDRDEDSYDRDDQGEIFVTDC